MASIAGGSGGFRFVLLRDDRFRRVVDQVQSVDKAIVRLVDADFPVVAAQAQHFVVLAYQSAGLFDGFVGQDCVLVILQALGCALSALGFYSFALGDPLMVALFVVQGLFPCMRCPRRGGAI